MIPKVIHYCWFGGGTRPKYVQKCIESWISFFPDYKIQEWNEENFDVNMMAYTRDAYAAKKYAFVSDVARFWILKKYGGLYFDVDVEIVASFDDILKNGSFMGVEIPSINHSFPMVNPGLGIGAEVNNNIINAIFEYYKGLQFVFEKGIQPQATVVTHTTEVLSSKFGLMPTNDIQRLNGVTIYPMDFFNPFNDLTGQLNLTKNTHSIHWFAKTWTSRPMWYYRITRVLHRFFGIKLLNTIKFLILRCVHRLIS